MKKKFRYTALALLSLAALVLGVLLLNYKDVVVLDAKGLIGLKQRDLFINATLLMLIVVIPVFVLTFFIIWKYRASNKKAKYNPDWDYNAVVESIWWGIPFLIIIVLSIMTWVSTRDLDPYKPIASDKKPLTIQAVALQWKWLFIYPEQGIATINYIEFPEKTPLAFEITSDAPMNSFWIPQLGGQIYAMAGMRSQLHLIADEQGVFNGCSAHLSGKGFAGMNFIAKATSEEEFQRWVSSVGGSPNRLDLKTYNRLVVPSEDEPFSFYKLETLDLFNQILMKFTMPMPPPIKETDGIQ